MLFLTDRSKAVVLWQIIGVRRWFYMWRFVVVVFLS